MEQIESCVIKIYIYESNSSQDYSSNALIWKEDSVCDQYIEVFWCNHELKSFI